MYDYAILDELVQASEEREEAYKDKYNLAFTTRVMEVTEPWKGSSDNIRAFILHNYISTSGLLDLLVIIRETATGQTTGGFRLNNVETAIYPIYFAKQDAFELPEPEPIPEGIHPDNIKFIISKRSLPKKPRNPAIEFDPEKHKWPINLIAETLHINNRTVAQYCRATNI